MRQSLSSVLFPRGPAPRMRLLINSDILGQVSHSILIAAAAVGTGLHRKVGPRLIRLQSRIAGVAVTHSLIFVGSLQVGAVRIVHAGRLGSLAVGEVDLPPEYRQLVRRRSCVKIQE